MLSQAGLPCTGFKVVPKDQRGTMQLGDPLDYAKCDLDGEGIVIQVWKDEGQLENWEGALNDMVCAVGKAFGVVNLDWVRGDLWTIVNISQTLADKIGAATGATPVHVKCE